ncbi:MAG: alpha/beta hydrolase [Bacteroidota bacterium]|nr:alpha/beta hydrolase [Bacteroidota bacterium]
MHRTILFLSTLFLSVLIFINPLMAEEVSIKVKALNLHGTLEVPSTDKPVPLAILIAGSGPTDRNGNNPGIPGKNNSLKQLAEKLLAQGIASFRYDKRMIGKSVAFIGLKEQDVTLEDFIQDAQDCAEYFKKDKRFSKIIFIGHSEGSLIGMLASQRTKVEGFVSIAGLGRRPDVVLAEQLNAQGMPADLLKECSTIIDSLKAGKTVEKVSPILFPLFRPSAQPFIISTFKFDPAVEISKLQFPVLILQGTTDIQVSEADADLLNKSAKMPTLKIIKDMNHVMKMIPTKDRMEQIKAYSDPSFEISVELVKSVTDYIKKL